MKKFILMIILLFTGMKIAFGLGDFVMAHSSEWIEQAISALFSLFF